MICTNCKNETTHIKNGLCLDCYFKIYSPTKTTNTSWIFQQAPPRFDRPRNNTKRLYNSVLAERVIHGQYSLDEKNNQLRIGNFSFLYTVKGLDELALQSGILVGKWLIYRNGETIDTVWKHVALSVMKRKLGPSAKVSTAMQRENSHVICVYTENYMDEADVQRVREELYALSFGESLCYKPDLYTYINIYRGTSSIKPCRYRM